MAIVGVDPGLSGALAILADDGTPLSVFSLPTVLNCRGKPKVDVAGVWDVLDEFEGVEEISLVVLEEAHSRPTDSHVAAFSFGFTNGRLSALFDLRGYKVHEPSPAVWKRAMLKDGEKETAVKYVQQKYPEVSLLPTPRSRKPSADMAEALILAEYGRMLRKKGEL